MKRILIAALAALTALALASCRGEASDGAGVATAGGTPTSNATGDNSDAGADDGDVAEKMRKFAACMREQGIDMPDPEVDGEGRVRVRIGGGAEAGGAQPGGAEAGGGAPPDREKFEAAQKACKQYLPNGGEPPKMDPEQVEQARQFAKCMRENGVPDFPDPQADGSVRIEAGPGTGIQPDSQAFKDAHAKCEQYMPRRQAGGS